MHHFPGITSCSGNNRYEFTNNKAYSHYLVDADGGFSFKKEQSLILFQNINTTIEHIDDHWLTTTGFKWLPWKQLYHVIHSLDQWFINPYVYTHPDFHTPGLNSLADTNYDKHLSKEELQTYYEKVRQKVTTYLDSIDVTSLIEKPDNCQFTRFALILGQIRHTSYHIGFLHCCMYRDYEKLPVFKGLGPPMEPVKTGDEEIYYPNRRRNRVQQGYATDGAEKSGKRNAHPGEMMKTI